MYELRKDPGNDKTEADIWQDLYAILTQGL